MWRKYNVKEAVDLYIEVKKILRKSSMNLYDCMSNNKDIPSDDRVNRGPMEILGLTWFIESDKTGLNNKIK